MYATTLREMGTTSLTAAGQHAVTLQVIAASVIGELGAWEWKAYARRGKRLTFLSQCERNEESPMLIQVEEWSASTRINGSVTSKANIPGSLGRDRGLY
jgi:hypothetical protein